LRAQPLRVDQRCAALAERDREFFVLPRQEIAVALEEGDRSGHAAEYRWRVSCGPIMHVPLSVLEFRDRAAAYFGAVEGVIDGERRFTYAEYAERTHRLANALRQMGMAPGDRVSFISYNCHQLLEAYYGVIEAGAVLNPVNIRLAPAEIGYILSHAGSKAVFYHHDFTPMVAQLRDSLPDDTRYVVLEGSTDGVASLEYEALLAGASADYRPPEIDENAVARAVLHQRHDRPAEGRDADPPGPAPARRVRRAGAAHHLCRHDPARRSALSRQWLGRAGTG